MPYAARPGFRAAPARVAAAPARSAEEAEPRVMLAGGWLDIPDGGASVLPDGSFEDDLNFAGNGGGTASKTVFTATVPDFEAAPAVRLETTEVQANPWGVQLRIPAVGDAAAGDVMLVTFFARGARDDGSSTDVLFKLQRDGSPFTGYGQAPVNAAGEWTQYAIPLAMGEAREDGSLALVVHAGRAVQALEIARLQVLNYGDSLGVGDLPSAAGAGHSRGSDPDAWRAAADARIEAHRKADLSVTVLDAAGDPVPGAEVRVEQVRHEFGFGTAVKARWLAVTEAEFDALPSGAKPNGMTWDDVLTYRRTVEQNFTKVVLENDLKWGAWESAKPGTSNSFRQAWTDRALDWAAARGIEVRGHFGAWGTISGPTDWNFNGDSVNDVPQRLTDHIAEKIPAVGGRVSEWDAMNHPIGWTGDTLENRYGSDFDADRIKQVAALSPEGVENWVNEDQAFAGGGRADAYAAYIGRMLDRGAPIDGIGFQAHFGGDGRGMDELYAELERFAQLAPKLQLTELDYDSPDRQRVADYLADVLRLSFSHPAMDGIMQWGFWEDAHWRPNSALFDSDWTPRPLATAYQGLLFDEWWTDETAAAGVSGELATRAFRGDYRVHVTVGGETVTQAATLGEGGLDLTVQVDADSLWQAIPEGGVLMTAPNPLDAGTFVGSQHATREVIAVDEPGLPVESAVRVTVNEAQPNPWDVQLVGESFGDAEAGDALLISFFARGTSGNESGTTAATSYFQHGGPPHTKHGSAPVRVGPEWTQILVPFEMTETEPDGEHLVNLFVGDLEQTVEIAGYQLWNFNQTYTVDELPKTKVTYPGQEADAPWRAEAAARIDQHRKADAEITVVDGSGNPVEGAVVRLEQQTHEFQFGVAAKAKWLGITEAEFDALPAWGKPAGMVWDDVLTYRQVLEQNYNKIVLENDLKWGGWNTSLSDDQNNFRISWTNRALQWAADRGMEVRGHFGAWGNIDGPTDWNQGGDASEGLDQRLTDHIAAKIPALEGRVEEWDAVNHPVGWSGDTLESRYGADFNAGIFEQMRDLNPDAQLWVNEGQLLSGGGRQDAYEAYIGRMLDRGAPVDGIGFMGHFDDGSLVGMNALYNRLERFAALVPNLMVTEYDYLTDDPELAAAYMRDFMTVAFSHPAMDSFMQWGFWEDAFFEPGRALWASDWSINPNGAAYVDQTQAVWHTDETAATAADGRFAARGFKGEYALTVEVNGQTRTIPVTLTDGGLTQTVVVATGEAPVLDRVNASVRYVENRRPAFFARSARVSDADASDWGGATLTLSIPDARPEDVLGLVEGDGVKPGVAEFGTGSGVVTIARPGRGDVPVGDATYAGGELTVVFRAGTTAADATRVLRRAAYWSGADTLVPGRSIEASVTDAGGNRSAVGAGSTAALNLVNVADNPVLGGVLDGVEWTEGGGPAAIAAAAEVSDLDTSDWGGARLDAVVITPRDAGEGFSLGLAADAGASVDSASAGATLSLDGRPAATLLRPAGDARLTAVFLPGVTAADVTRVLRLVEFDSASDAPRGPKTVRVTLTDPAGGRGVVQAALAVTATNDAPRLLNVGGRAVAAGAGGPARVLASSLAIEDPDYRGGGGRLSASASAGLGVLTVAADANVSLASSDVLYRGEVVGLATGLGTASLSIEFNAAATPAAVRSVGRRLAFGAAATAAGTSGTVTFVFEDERGLASPPEAVTVDVSGGASLGAPAAALGGGRTLCGRLDELMAVGGWAF